MVPRWLVAVVFISIVFIEVPLHAQRPLHYHFKPGERLRYHFKISANFDAMRRRGGREAQTDFEADPEWNIQSVTMDGGTLAVLTVKDRAETYKNGAWRMSFLHFTPQSQIAMDANGNLLFAKILVDDTERQHTKAYIGKIPGLRLLPDIEAFRPHFERLWYTFDTVQMDTMGTAVTVSFDSTSARPFEHDTMVYGRMDTFLTTPAIPYEYLNKGKTTYSLRDTTVGTEHFWALDVVTDAESSSVRFPNLRPNESHKSSVLLFRKEDGILQAWHYTFENHNGSTSSNSEMWLTLTAVEGD